MPAEEKYTPHKTLRTVTKTAGKDRGGCRAYCNSLHSPGSEEWLICLENCQAAGGPPEKA